MNPTIVRSFQKSAVRLAAHAEHGQGSLGRWMFTAGGVALFLTGGALVVAQRNNAQNSHIRNIFRNERGTGAAHL